MPETAARDLAGKLIAFLETGAPPDGLFAPDVFCDFTLPQWRLQAQGAGDVVALRHAGHPGTSRVPQVAVRPHRHRIRARGRRGMGHRRRVLVLPRAVPRRHRRRLDQPAGGLLHRRLGPRARREARAGRRAAAAVTGGYDSVMTDGAGTRDQAALVRALLAARQAGDAELIEKRRGQPAPGPAFRRAPGAGARAAVRGVRASDGRAAPVQARGRARQGVGVRRLSRTVSRLRPRGHRSRLEHGRPAAGGRRPGRGAARQLGAGLFRRAAQPRGAARGGRRPPDSSPSCGWPPACGG